MKLTLSPKTLLQSLQQVIGVVERKHTLPILSNVLINKKNNVLSITGTDLEVELVSQLKAEHIENLDSVCLTLPGRKLIDICKSLPENSLIELHQEKNYVTLKSERSQFTLGSLPSDNFPSIETQETALSFTLPEITLKHLLLRTSFAIAQQNVRLYLNGMLFEISNHNLCAVATDGHRLALNKIEIPVEYSYKKQIIIPSKGITELTRLLDENETDIKITVTSNYIRAKNKSIIFTSRLIEGQFPDYEKVIPKPQNKVMLVKRDILKNALHRVAILCNQKIRAIRFETKKHSLKISSNNLEQETAQEEIDVEYNGTPFEVGFNVSYLIDILSILKTDTISLFFAEPNNSLLIQETNQKNDSCFVVMPMRI